MTNGLRIGSPFGIGVYLHWTFPLLLLFYGIPVLFSQGFLAATFAITFILAIFGCVVLHELGHALAARKFGIPTRSITLYPIGGVAQLAALPQRPYQELIIAVAGPAVNVVIAIFLAPIALPVLMSINSFGAFPASGAEFIVALFAVNVVLVLFNMIPAFPMDGGRVLRALLSFGGDYLWATNIASRLGQGIAVLFFIFGLFGNVMLILIAVFIFLAAAAERRAAAIQFRFEQRRPVFTEGDWEVFVPGEENRSWDWRRH